MKDIRMMVDGKCVKIPDEKSPTSSLPEWIEKMRHPDYSNDGCCVPCDEFPKVIEALAIAWEALEWYETESPEWLDSRGIPFEHAMAFAAMRRIREMGASQAPGETK